MSPNVGSDRRAANARSCAPLSAASQTSFGRTGARLQQIERRLQCGDVDDGEPRGHTREPVDDDRWVHADRPAAGLDGDEPVPRRARGRRIDHRFERLLLARAGRRDEDRGTEDRSGDVKPGAGHGRDGRIGRAQSVDRQIDDRALPTGRGRGHGAQRDVDRPCRFRRRSFPDVVLDASRHVGRLGQAEPDQMSSGVAWGQRRARASVELLLEGDLVPRAIGTGDHGRGLKALQTRAVELECRRVGPKRGAEHRLGRPSIAEPSREGFAPNASRHPWR